MCCRMWTARWLAWTTLTLVAYLGKAVPSTGSPPCQLNNDPTLRDLVFFRLCLEEERGEHPVDVTGPAQIEVPNTKRDDPTDWPADETGNDLGVDGEFPYCWPLTPSECRMLLITLDDILRLSEADDNDTGNEVDGGRVKRATARDILARLRARQIRPLQKRLTEGERKLLRDYLANNNRAKAGRRGISGRRFGRSLPDGNKNINEDSHSGHVIQKRDIRTADDDVVRSRRAVLSRMSPRAQQLLAAFKAWRAKNGYGAGKGSARWGWSATSLNWPRV